MSVTNLHEDERGKFYVDGNEVVLQDKVAGGDPVAVRLRSENETKGKISIDIKVNGVWRELGFAGFKADERGRTNPAHRNALEVEFWTHIAGRDTYEDSAQQQDYERMFAVRHDGPVFYKGGAAASNVLRSTNGRVLLAAQDDGNLVLYVDGQPVRALFGLPPELVW